MFLLEFKYLKELLDYHDHLNYFDKNFINNSEEGLYDVHLLINATVCQHFVKKSTGNSSRVTQDIEMTCGIGTSTREVCRPHNSSRTKNVKSRFNLSLSLDLFVLNNSRHLGTLFFNITVFHLF